LLPTRGILLADEPPQNADLILKLAQRAESAGLDSVWVGDSLVAKPRLEPLSALAAIAATTQRVRLGTSVMLMALRQPVLLAQTMATVDLISKGRLLIAAGVGGAFNEAQQGEWRAAGVSVNRRASRLEEMVQIVKGLTAGETLDWQSRNFSLDSVALGHPPVRATGVPVLLACHWRSPAREAQFRRAGRWADGVISISDSPEEYAQVMEGIATAAREAGRDPDQLEKVMYLTVNLDSDRSKAEAEAEKYLLGYYGAEIWGDRWGPFGDPERVKDRIAQYIEVGTQTVVVRFASFDPERQMDVFLDRVAPAFS
jgi:alkanesulfonate monooxygenase SsuD/methylene tetrahydromethanopterin reductase-like flavin-dependent oxidoreductase (luciferase family)